MSLHINKIIDQIYLGDIRAANNLFSMKSNGVTHVLQALGGMAPPFPKHFKYKVLEVMDVPWENLERHFLDSIAFMRKAI